MVIHLFATVLQIIEDGELTLVKIDNYLKVNML